MTEEVSHASSAPSPNTLSIVNIVCVYASLCESVCLCVLRASEKSTDSVGFAGMDCSECSPDHFYLPLDNGKNPTAEAHLSFLPSVVVTFSWSTVSFITLYFPFSSVLAGKEQLSHASVSGVTLVSGICHWGMTVLCFPMCFPRFPLPSDLPPSDKLL